MAERAVVWVDGVQVPGRDMRLAQAALLTPTAALTARAGVLFGLEVTATSPATMAVSVAAGQCAVTVDETAPGGVALCANDATVTVPIAAADPTNPRIDLAVARVYAELTAAGSRRWALEMVQGTPAAIPDAPALPANSLLLRAVTVPANASSIASGDISTTLPARTAAAGGITPSRDGVDVVGAVVGQYRHRLDTGALERWDGTAWRLSVPGGTRWFTSERTAQGQAGPNSDAVAANFTLVNATVGDWRIDGVFYVVNLGNATADFAVWLRTKSGAAADVNSTQVKNTAPAFARATLSDHTIVTHPGGDLVVSAVTQLQGNPGGNLAVEAGSRVTATLLG